jgi:hypothetical protein
MDQKLNKIITEYVTDFKQNIKKKAIECQFVEKDKIELLIAYMFEYKRLTLSKEDVSKRKRIKNSIPSMNRCHAKRANGEQCTRKQKAECLFCGTHEKGTPHGVVTLNDDENGNGKPSIVTAEVFAQEIGGIVYYLDKSYNVFNTEDVMNNAENTRVIAQYTYQDDAYHIPAFGI